MWHVDILTVASYDPWIIFKRSLFFKYLSFSCDIITLFFESQISGPNIIKVINPNISCLCLQLHQQTVKETLQMKQQLRLMQVKMLRCPNKATVQRTNSFLWIHQIIHEFCYLMFLWERLKQKQNRKQTPRVTFTKSVFAKKTKTKK